MPAANAPIHSGSYIIWCQMCWYVGKTLQTQVVALSPLLRRRSIHVCAKHD